MLKASLLKDRNERKAFLESTNHSAIITRPIWRLINKLDVYKDCKSSKSG